MVSKPGKVFDDLLVNPQELVSVRYHISYFSIYVKHIYIYISFCYIEIYFISIVIVTCMHVTVVLDKQLCSLS